MLASSGQLGKVGNNGSNGVLHVPEQGEDRFAITDTIGFRERYMRGEIIHLVCNWFVWNQPDAEVKHLVASFYRLCRLEGGRDSFLMDKARRSECLIEHDNDAVFVDVVELAEDIERVCGGVRWVSLVWLRSFNERENISAHQRLPFTFADAPDRFEIARALRHGERNLRVLADLARMFPHDERADQVIQRGTQLMNRVSEDDGLLRAWFRRIGAVFQCPVSLKMDAGRAHGVFRLRPDTDCGFEVSDVFLGPLHFPIHGTQVNAHMLQSTADESR
jgi:hypothetical protein